MRSLVSQDLPQRNALNLPSFFFLNDPPPPESYTLPLHAPLPISPAPTPVIPTVPTPNAFSAYLEGVAVPPDGTRVYVVGGGPNRLFVIDTATNTGTDTGVTG